MEKTVLEKLDPRLFLVVILAIIITVFTRLYFQSESYLVDEVSVNHAKGMLEAGAMVVDARSSKAYREGHLPGAVSYPLQQLKENIPNQLQAYKNKPVLVYGCSDSCGPHATYLLVKAGYTMAMNIDGGYCAWKNAGYKIVASSPEKSSIK